MVHIVLFDLAPDPVSGAIGVVLAVLLVVLGVLAVFAAALVVFLWYRKRRLRGVEMVRPDLETAAQPSNPNQP